jgi:hypothetical protein
MSVISRLSLKVLNGWRSLSGFLAGAIILFAAICVADALVEQFHRFQLMKPSLPMSFLFCLIPGSISLAAIVPAVRRQEHPWLQYIPLGLLAASALCRLGWALQIDSFQVNDFGYYTRCAEDFLRTGSPAASAFCDPVYWKRTAFYTYPVFALFGPSLLALKLVNVALLSATNWLFFKTAEWTFGFRTAIVALAFFIWQPDLWYAATMASHDIPGTFWLSLFFFAAALLHRRLREGRTGWRLLPLSAGLGLVLFFLDVSRTYQYGALLALFLFVAIRTVLSFAIPAGIGNGPGWFREVSSKSFPGGISRRPQILLPLLLFIMLPLAVYVTGSRAFWARWQYPPAKFGSGLICFLTSMDVTGTTEWAMINNWQNEQCPSIPPDQRNSFAIRKLLQDVTLSPARYLFHLERKNRILAQADDYLIEWNKWRDPEIWDHTSPQVKRINHYHMYEQAGAIAILQIVLLLLVLWRLLFSGHLPFRMLEVLWIAFSLVYFCMFLFLVESQARYDIFLIFPFSCFAAVSVRDIVSRLRENPEAGAVADRTAHRRLARGAVAIAAVIAGFWSLSAVVAGGPLTLRDQSGFEKIPDDRLPLLASKYKQVPPRFEVNNHKQLMLAYHPGDHIEVDSILTARKSFRIKERTEHHLRFFVSTYSTTQSGFEDLIPWPPDDLEYMIYVNETLVDGGSFKQIDGNIFYSFSEEDLPFAPEMTIQLVVRNRKTIDRVSEYYCPVISLELIDLQ